VRLRQLGFLLTQCSTVVLKGQDDFDCDVTMMTSWVTTHATSSTACGVTVASIDAPAPQALS